MKTILCTLYFNREKEDNWDLEEVAESLGWKNSKDIVYVGREINVKVEISNIDHIATKVIEINGVDVSDKNIYI